LKLTVYGLRSDFILLTTHGYHANVRAVHY